MACAVGTGRIRSAIISKDARVNPLPNSLFRLAIAGLALLALAGCKSRGGEFDESGGITAVRSACPLAAIPAMTGDITLFDPPASRDASAIDLTAAITNLRSTCAENGDRLETEATFDVRARRIRTESAREVVLPYFSVVTRGGTAVVAKRVGEVRLSFAAGQDRASASARASSSVDRAAATLPPEIERKIRNKRRAGDADAAIDPLADPEVRAALQRTTFELLVGFNLTADQLRYNATR